MLMRGETDGGVEEAGDGGGIEAQRDAAVAAAMEAGCTWAEIGAALGVSAQAAHRRFRWLRYSPVTGETWREPPLGV